MTGPSPPFRQYGRPPLHFAAARGFARIVAALLADRRVDASARATSVSIAIEE